MKIVSQVLALLLPLSVMACDRAGAASPSVPDPQTAEPMVQLESLQLSTSLRLTDDALPARFVSMSLSRSSPSEMEGTLVLDPNTCSLDAFGDREACTRIAVRVFDVQVRRVQLTDPARMGRQYFEIVGEGLPQGLALIVRGDLQAGELERSYLKLGTELVPLYLEARG